MPTRKKCGHTDLPTMLTRPVVKQSLMHFMIRFLAARADPVVRYANETAISLITHLKECYAFISPIELVDNYERMCQNMTPSAPSRDFLTNAGRKSLCSSRSATVLKTTDHYHCVRPHFQHWSLWRCMQGMGEILQFGQDLGKFQSSLYN
jgi:hypothetical protein